LAYRESATAAQDREFWKSTLAGELPVLALPLAQPRPAMQTYRARTLSFRMSRDRVEALKKFARRASATPFMVLFAAHAMTMRRFTAQDEVIVGTPVAIRDGETDAALAGYATNLLPIRCRISGSMSGVQCVQAIRRRLLAAFEHQALPFGDVLDELQLERDLSRPPLVGTTFTLDRPLRDPGFADTRATLRPLPFTHVPFDLTLSAIEDAGGLLFYCVYNRDLLDERVAQDFLDHYDRLIDALVAAPDAKASRLVTLGPGAAQRMIVDWNRTAIDHGPDRNILQTIERELRRRPDAIVAEEAVEPGTARPRVRQMSARALL